MTHILITRNHIGSGIRNSITKGVLDLNKDIFRDITSLDFHSNAKGLLVSVLGFSSTRVKEVSFKECINLEEVGPLPASLEKVDFSRCNKLIKSPDLSGTMVKELRFQGCINLAEVGSLPDSLEIVDFSGCNNLIKSPDLSKTQVKEARFLLCINLAEVWSLPASLEKVDFSRCNKLIKSPDLSGTMVKELHFQGCINLEEFGSLPDSLEKVDFSECDKLIKLPDLSSKTQLKSVSFYECKNLEEVGPLPASLEKVDFSRCNKLIKSPDLSGTMVKEVSFLGCINLEEFGPLPASLEKVDFSECNNLIKSPDLSSKTQLKSVDFQGCINLEEVGPLPASLEILDLDGCSKLQDTLELRAMLLSLEEGGCIVYYPTHIAQKGVEVVHEKIEEIIKSYKKQNPDKASDFSSLKTLITRFTSESLGQRGSSTTTTSKAALKEIIEQLAPVLKVLENNPKQLEVADLLASHYLKACINQPVRGVLVIASILKAVDNKEASVTKKIEDSKFFKVLCLVENLVSSNKDPIGELVEVEAGNVLTREISKKLIEDGLLQKTDVIAVPKGVAYERTVKPWVNGEIDDKGNKRKRIDHFYEIIKKELEEDKNLLASGEFERIAGEFTSIDPLYLKAWAIALFPEQTEGAISSIEMEYEAAFKAIYSEDKEEQNNAIEKYRHLIGKYESKINKDINPDENGQIYVALQMDLESAKIGAIKQMLKDAVSSALNHESIAKKEEDFKSQESANYYEPETFHIPQAKEDQKPINPPRPPSPSPISVENAGLIRNDTSHSSSRSSS